MNEENFFVLTGVGQDRHGLVEEISGWLAERQASIADSRMALLGGEFAIIILVNAPANSGDLTRELPRLSEQTGLDIQIRPTVSPSGRGEQAPAVPYTLRCSTVDHPGIVKELTAVLRQYAVNIESLETQVVPAPTSGTPVFSLVALVAVPASVKIAELRESLEDLSARENLDLIFHAGSDRA